MCTFRESRILFIHAKRIDEAHRLEVYMFVYAKPIRKPVRQASEISTRIADAIRSMKSRVARSSCRDYIRCNHLRTCPSHFALFNEEKNLLRASRFGPFSRDHACQSELMFHGKSLFLFLFLSSHGATVG